ncbi:MAG: hypothetical protein ACHQNA_10530 [Acidimicrobiales bacterium]
MLDRDPGEGHAVPGRLLGLISELNRRYGNFTAAADATLAEALAADRDRLDLTYRLPGDVGPATARIDALLDEAEGYCAAGDELLSLAATADVVAFSKWFLLEFARQAEGRAPTAWADRSAARPAGD